MGLLDKLFNPGKKYMGQASNLANQGVIKGFNFSGPGGVGGNFTFSGGRATGGGSLGAFGPAFQQLLAGAGDMSGLDMSRITGATDALGETLGNQSWDQISGMDDYGAWGDVMSQAGETVKKDPFELGATISDKLRALSERKNQRLANKMFDRLKSTGNLTSSAGMQQAYEMQAQQDEQALKFDLAGLDFGQNMIRDAYGRMTGAGQMREGIAGRTFAESGAINQQQALNAMNQWGAEQGLFGMGLQNAQFGQDAGLQNLSMAMQLQQLPMMNMLNMMNMAGVASGSNLNAAGVQAGIGANAKSPWLEALNAVGQFWGNVKKG